MPIPNWDLIEAARARCDDAWRKAGSTAPCYARSYMEAREAYQRLLIAAGLMRERDADWVNG